MHDIDRAMYELESESYESGSLLGEVYGEYEQEQSYEGSYENNYGAYEYGDHEMDAAHFGSHELEEGQELELATQLLEVGSDTELDQFLGSLLRKAVPHVRNFFRSKAGQALGGTLKSVAKQALPNVAGMAGNLGLPGGVGGQLMDQAGRWATGALGLEAEGLSAEDSEFEAARSFVRFATEAARQAADAPPAANPAQVARTAAASAAAVHAPALVPLLKGGHPGSGRPGGQRGASGRWIRQGNRIILFGV